MGPRAGLDGRKFSSPPGFDPAIPTELPGPPTRGVVLKTLISRYKAFFNSEPNHLECCATSTGKVTAVSENRIGSISGIKQSKKTILLALFNPEDKNTMLLRNVGNVYRPTERSIPEESSASL